MTLGRKTRPGISRSSRSASRALRARRQLLMAATYEAKSGRGGRP
eukprot:CAMPEP_0175723200 /NCGR_PEP_ID=MMETSP0097-20121207/46614_1 /TAXON_ID=311494 /ORGANISM="Alexandrium monilatum, Strain CCMP3105" /LENGTH=44 /DNA_ID= /DNA_START= /DNA_END= /DNA_ORIENTATION=